MSWIERLVARDVAGSLDALAAGADPEATDPESGQSALLLAVDQCALDVVRALLDRGADVDRSVDGTRAVQAASYGPRLAILRTLLEAGADPNTRPGEDEPPLYTAASDPEAIALLLAHGAAPDTPTALDETPLSFAVSWSLLPSVERLLAGGADPNRVMRELDWSVPMFAAQEGDVRVIRALLDAGADPGFVNGRGQTAFAVALDHGRAEAAALLKEGGGFGPEVAGMRARLRVGTTVPREVWLDLQATGPDAVELRTEDPVSLQWELWRDGAPVAPSWGRMDVLASPTDHSVAPGFVVAWRVSHRDERHPAALDLVTAAWEPDPAPGVLRCLRAGTLLAEAVLRPAVEIP